MEEILAQPKNKFIVAGVVQNFEFTFELSWKALQRFLKLRGLECASPAQVIRTAFAEGLIDSTENWMEFLKFRNLTVHTYNENLADQVYEAAVRFPQFVRALLKNLSVQP